MTKQGILDGMKKSLEDLGVDSVCTCTGILNAYSDYGKQVDLYYFHSPDPATPIEESLSAIQELYAAGKFKRVSWFISVEHQVS